MTEDLHRAKEILSAEGCTCVFVCGDVVLKRYERGIIPLVSLCERGERMMGYSAADKIVGRAAAMLYLKLGVKELYAEVLNEGAKEVLEVGGLNFSYAELTSRIVNRRGTGDCPMEEAVRATDDPDEAFIKLKCKLLEMGNGM